MSAATSSWFQRFLLPGFALKAVIIGGGYIGVEMAEALAERGFQTTLATRTRVMSKLDPPQNAETVFTYGAPQLKFGAGAADERIVACAAMKAVAPGVAFEPHEEAAEKPLAALHRLKGREG